MVNSGNFMAPSVAVSALCMIFAIVALTGWTDQLDDILNVPWVVSTTKYTDSNGVKTKFSDYEGLRQFGRIEEVEGEDGALRMSGPYGPMDRAPSFGPFAEGRMVKTQFGPGATYLTCKDKCKDAVWDNTTEKNGNAKCTNATPPVTDCHKPDCEKECELDVWYLYARGNAMASSIYALISFFVILVLSILRFAFDSWNTIVTKIFVVVVALFVWSDLLGAWADFVAVVHGHSDRIDNTKSDYEKMGYTDIEMYKEISVGCIMLIMCWLLSVVPLVLHAVWPHKTRAREGEELKSGEENKGEAGKV